MGLNILLNRSNDAHLAQDLIDRPKEDDDQGDKENYNSSFD